MYGLILVLHVIVCLLLIAVILVQGGRGGMAETLGGSGSQSLFGGGANAMMTKVTATGAVVFMVTCVSLALLSVQRGRSVIERTRLAPPSAAGILPPTEPGAPSEARGGEGSAAPGVRTRPPVESSEQPKAAPAAPATPPSAPTAPARPGPSNERAGAAAPTP